jgi:FkbM family methyltransferase
MRPSWFSRWLKPKRQSREAAELESLREQLRDTPRFTSGVIRVGGLEIHYADSASLVAGYEIQMVRQSNDFTASRPDPLVIDCGGNIGLSVIRSKQLYPDSRIVVFEPDPELCGFLRTNLTAAGYRDVQVVEAAVWTENGEHLFLPDGADGGMLVDEPAGSASGGLVKTVRLADYLAGDPVDFLKIDIEGAELPVLQGCRESLRNVNQLIVEVHYRLSSAHVLAEILAILYEAGFRVSVNSYGPWVDLRHPLHGDPAARADQYLLLCAWREAGPA